jgi:CheY-like chemotaxis protein
MKRGFTLLLAEDDPNDAMLFQRALEESARIAAVPIRLQVIGDGEQAIEYLKGEGEFQDRDKYPFPEIVVTDLKMPRLNGLGVLAWLRENEQYQRMPKILLSGSSEECDVDEAYRLGANTFFQKPDSLGEYRELVYHIVCYWAHTQRPMIRHAARAALAT